MASLQATALASGEERNQISEPNGAQVMQIIGIKPGGNAVPALQASGC
jgi:hypothetical protein